MLDAPDIVQLGGVVVLALALLEVLKVTILRLISGDDTGVERTIDGFAKEVAWRTEVGRIIREQHELSKKHHELLQSQGDTLRAIVTILDRHKENAEDARERLVSIEQNLENLTGRMPDAKR